MMNKTFIITALLGSLLGTRAAEFYTAPNGSPNADGSKQNPWDIKTALNQPSSVHAGDTIWLRGGTYMGNFFSALTGLANNYITVRGYPGERATIDGNSSDPTAFPLTINGSWAIYRNFEVVDTATYVAGQPAPVGIQCQAPNNKIINVVVHDAGMGIGFWTPAVNSEVYGCLLYNNGVEGRDHGIYTQNDTGTKLIHDNIIFNNAGIGIHAYTSGGQIRGFDIQGNIIFNNGSKTGTSYDNIFVGGDPPSDRLNIVSNYTYVAANLLDRPNVRISYGDHSTNPQGTATVHDNYMIGGQTVFVANDWTSLTFQNNVVVRYGGLVPVADSLPPLGVAISSYNWDHNTYYGMSSSASAFTSGAQIFAFDTWKTYSSLDAHSTYTTGNPTGVKVVIRPNQYEAKRANVMIFNWDLLNNVNVDLSGVLSVGDSFEVRNAQDFYAPPVISGTYAGGALSLPMTNLTLALPRVRNVIPKVTGPLFNTFVVLGVQGATNANSPPAISTIAPQTINANTSTPALAFTISDAQTPVASLSLTASSSNPALVPNGNIVFGGSDANRTVTITPASGQSGTTTVTIFVSDGSLSASQSFTVTVNPINQAPTITSVANQTVSLGDPPTIVSFIVGDSGTPAASLTVTAASSNPTLLPSGSLVLGGSGANRTLTLTPVANLIGTAIISLAVSDGVLTTTESFGYTVNPVNQPPVVSAGQDQLVSLDVIAALNGTASDDGLPNPPARLTSTWSVASGPGDVAFGDPSALVTTARFTLEGFYLLRLTVTDGQLSTSQDVNVVVTPPENLGPAISSVGEQSVTSSNAVLSWLTSVPADAQVQFGPTTFYGQATPVTSVLSVNHQVSLGGLIPNTTYHFRVISADATGASAYSDDYSFTTRPLPTETRVYVPVAAASGVLSLPMVLYTDPADSQQQYISTVVGNQGSATFRFSVPQAGDYVIWCRIVGMASTRDSFLVSMDNGAGDVYDAAEGRWSSAWQWTRINGRAGGNPLTLNPRIFTLTAGNHSLVIRGREANAYLNRMIITDDLNYVPADNQPVAGVGNTLTLATTVVRITIGPGYAMIANQFIRGGNTLAEVMPNVPNGTRLFKFDSASRLFSHNIFNSGAWSDPSQTLNPGEGAFIYNGTPTSMDVALTGQIPLSSPARQFSSGLHLISIPYPRSGPISTLIDFPLQVGDTIYKFDNSTGDYGVYTFGDELGNGIWIIEPELRVGEAFYLDRF